MSSVSSGSSRIRCIITGTTTSAVGSALLRRLQGLLRVELAAQDVGRVQRQPEHEVGEAPGMEQRRRDHRPLAGAQRDLREQRRERAERVGLGALRALRRPGRARGEDDEPARLVRRIEVVSSLSDSISSSSVASSVSLSSVLAPGDVTAEPDLLARLAGLLQQSAELLVVDQRHRLLALDHVGELRPGERGVHVEARWRRAWRSRASPR